MKILEKILKTSFSKTAMTHYLRAKETVTTVQEYENLFRELAFVLFEIDNCIDLKGLENKFYNNEKYPFFSEDHKEFLEQQSSLYADYLLAKSDYHEYDLEKVENLDNYKFL